MQLGYRRNFDFSPSSAPDCIFKTSIPYHAAARFERTPFCCATLYYHGKIPSQAYEINPYRLESHARTCILILDALIAQVLSDISSVLTESVRSKLAAASIPTYMSTAVEN